MTKAETSNTSKVSDFKFGKEIGHGSFSTVMIAKDLKTNRQCAAKVLDKAFISKHKMVPSVLIEKEVLLRLKHPFFIQLMCTFQDQERLYFIMTYAERGEILTYLTKLSCFDLTCSKFYSAEIILALEYLHSINIVHRDMKPENILLSDDMHIKICDFGSSLILDRPDFRCPSFTGTAQFVSPEMLGFGKEKRDSTSNSDDSDTANKNGTDVVTKIEEDKSLMYMMDIWAFGCIVYQFLSGRMPFHVRHSHHEYEIFQKIRKLEYEFPAGFDDTAQDFVTRLIVLDPAQRLGSPATGGHAAIKAHPLFDGIDFSCISECTPPLLMANIEPVVHDNWDEIPVGYEAAWRFNIRREFHDMEKSDKKKALETQERNNPFHRFVKGRLIIKQGILYKRRGLFTRKRMFLLTEGPHLFYVDPDSMQLKNEITLNQVASIEVKNEKVFYVITKKRTYFLEDPSGKADEWRQSIESLCVEHYGPLKEVTVPPSVASSSDT